MDEKKIFYKAVFDAGNSFRDIEKLTKEFEKVKKQEIAVREELKNYRKLLRDIAKDPSLKDSSEQYTDLEGKITRAELSLRELRKTQRTLNKEFDKLTTPEKSITRLRKETNLMRAELERSRRGIDLTEDEFDKLKRTIEKNQTAILKWDKSLKDGRTNVGRYRESIGNLSVGFANVAAGVAAAFAINDFTDFVKESVEAYDIQAQNEQKLLVALKGREEVQQRLLAQASQLQTDTQGLVTDEQIIQQQAYLASLGVTEEQINAIIKASVDLSAGANIPLESSVKNLAKTYSGLAGELGEAIPALRELTAEQLKTGAAVELVAKQFEGQAEAAGTAGIGAIRGYTMAIGDVKEEIGKELLPVQESLTKAQLRFFELLRDGLRFISPWIARLKEAPQFIRENRTTILALLTALIAFNAQSIAAAVNTLRQAAAQKAIVIATRAQVIAQNLLNAAMKANPIGLAVAAIGLLIAAFDQAIKRSSTFRAFISGIRESGIELFNVLKEAFGSFTTAFNEFSQGNLKAGFKSLANAFVKSNPIGIALTEGKRLGDAFNRGFEESKAEDKLKEQAASLTSSKNEFQKAGEDIAKGTVDGLQKGIGGDSGEIAKNSLEGLRKELQKLESELKRTAETDTTAITQKLEAIAATKDKIAQLEQVVERLGIALKKQNDEQLLTIETVETLELTPQGGEELTSLTAEIEREQFVQDELKKIRSKSFEEEVEARRTRIEQIRAIEDERANILTNVASQAATITGEFIGSALGDAEEFGRALIALGLDTLERLALLAIAEAQLKEIGSKGFIGIGTGLILAAVVRGIVAVARRALLAEHGLHIEGDDLPKYDHIIRGPSHAAGGVKVGRFIEAEGNEAYMIDEFGGRNIINKKSTRRFRPILNKIMGKKFPGKLALLDVINRAEGGHPLLPFPTFSGPRFTPPPRFVMPTNIFQAGGRVESASVAAVDNSEVVAELKALRADLQTLEIGVDALNKAQRKQQLSNRLNQA